MLGAAAAAAWLALAGTASAAPAPALFGNGKGINMPSAVWGERANAGAPSVYQLQPSRFSRKLIGQLQGAGFGFVRLVTTPAPLMTDDAAARARAIAWVGSLVDAYRAAGLGVIVDLHFWPTDDPAHQDNVVPDPRQRAALMQAQVALARMLAGRAGGGVALELINEPPCEVGGKPFDWASVQRTMVARVRAVAPRLPLVLTGCRGRPERLTQLNAAPYRADPNIFWTIHYYEPAAFVWQDPKGLRDVPFPPDPRLASSPAATARMLPPGGGANPGWLKNQLDKYLRGHRGQSTIGADIAAVAAWARRQGISPGRIFVGEFGTGLTPATATKVEEDERRWFRAVREEAARQGFAWALWALPSPGNLNYDPATGFVRPETLRALGMKVPAR